MLNTHLNGRTSIEGTQIGKMGIGVSWVFFVNKMNGIGSRVFLQGMGFGELKIGLSFLEEVQHC